MAPTKARAPNKTTGSPLERALDALHAGDFAVRLKPGLGIDAGTARAFNALAARSGSLCAELTRVGTSVRSHGGLKARASLPGASGDWKACAESVNAVIDDLVRPMTEAATVIDAVTRGNLARKMPTELGGAPVRGEYLRVSKIVNRMVDQLKAFASEVTRVAREVGTDGKLGGQAEVKGVAGTWNDLTHGVNSMADNLTSQVRNIAEVTTAVANGDLSRKITVPVKGEFLALKNTINTMVDQLNAFASEVTRVAREVGTEGNLGGQAQVRGVAGVWKELTDNVNTMAENVTGQVRGIARVVTAVANGDLKKKLVLDAKGEIAILELTINEMIDTLAVIAEQVSGVAREVGVDGRLGGQAEVPGAAGMWRDLTDNVNGLAANLSTQVRAIAEVAMAVTQGDLTRSISVEARGEVASLKDSINEMIGNLNETTRKNTRQDWLNSNLARFGRMLQGQRDLEAVSQMVLSELAKLVSSQVGLFYVLESGKSAPRLTLRAAYAPETGDSLDGVATAFQLGEGMVGQCAVERTRILVRSVPAGYVRISSGLGSAAPACLAILPVLFEGRVKAVVELASFESFSETHLAFLDQLMESLGIVLNTIEATTQTEELLRQSQSLTERLKAQQEELQRTNEMLEEKARLLTDQKVEVEGKNREVELASVALEEKAAQLALASKYKSEFLANMSHELRTPLNSLLILAKLLADDVDGNLTSKQIEFAETIYSSGRDLLALINEILDLSKIESGTMAVDLGDVTLVDVGEFAERGFRQVADDRGLSYELRLDPGLRASLRTDARRLQQVLRNLLSNAFKFTERGGVALHIHRATDGWRPSHEMLSSAPEVIAFSVSDTGIGIPPDKQEIIFDAFQQADGTTSRRFGGTGLGLSISREIARILGGSIGLKSEPGAGSTFTLYLPAEYGGSAATPHRPSANGLRHKKGPSSVGPRSPALSGAASHEAEAIDDDRASIRPGEPVLLVIDQDALRAAAVVTLAHERGFRCVVARRTDAVVELARLHRPIGVIFSAETAADAEGQGLDRLSHEPALRDIPWHVLWDGKNAPAADIGLKTYVAKPLRRDSLVRALREIAEYRDRPIRTASVAVPDDATRRDVVSLLAAEGLDVTAAASARASIETVRATHPDVAIVDLPAKGSESLIAALQRERGLRGISVSILTDEAHADDGAAVDAATVGRIGGGALGDPVAAAMRTSDVVAFLGRVRETPPSRRPGAPRPVNEESPLARKRVMVVDDDVRNVFAITSMLERHKMEVRYATSGQDAITSLEKSPDVDVVLMDIMMPGMDGYEAMQRIRRDARFASLPILALTAKAMSGDREKCLEAGASDYITKPVDSDQLLSLLPGLAVSVNEGDGGKLRRRPRGPAIGDEGLAQVTAAVLQSRGVRIGGYAPEFLIGLVAGALAREGVADVEALARRFATEPACAGRFLSSLWIGTTSLFRDPIAFHAIRRDVVPILRAGGFARIWIAGCSTGEEVDSLAIVLRDEGILERCRIYATDVNADALDVARRGSYPTAALREGIPRYHASGGRGSLCEIYTAGRGRVTFDPCLRAHVTFAAHDLGVDGRFQDFDLILCRNVMIWFGPAMRDVTLELLRSCLTPGGALVLGRRESPRDSPVGKAFERVTAGASLWRLPLRSRGSPDRGPNRIDIAARGALERAARANPDASAPAAASDVSETPRPEAAPTPELILAPT